MEIPAGSFAQMAPVAEPAKAPKGPTSEQVKQAKKEKQDAVMREAQQRRQERQDKHLETMKQQELKDQALEQRFFDYAIGNRGRIRFNFSTAPQSMR
jgi:hypothetical protein